MSTHTCVLGGLYGNSIVLPSTSTDSLVYSAGANAELIYGDEGTDDIPPYFGFDKSHRIQRGISGLTAVGLTTVHGSYLPDAWGGDEFVQGPEFDMSAPSLPLPITDPILPLQFAASNAAPSSSESGF
jgi:hypothetical protein